MRKNKTIETYGRPAVMKMKQQRNANEGAKTNRKEYTPEFTKNKLNKRTKITINQVTHVKEKRIIDKVFHLDLTASFVNIRFTYSFFRNFHPLFVRFLNGSSE